MLVSAPAGARSRAARMYIPAGSRQLIGPGRPGQPQLVRAG